jgi:branched-chain amino acid transport system permease protein
VLVLGLAAMALNFLLGFTGVLSFGHAAYFGLGAYGAGLTLKFCRAQHAARHAGRHRCSAASPALIGCADRAPARRLFRHGARSPSARCSTSSPSAGTLHRRRRRAARLARQPIDLRFHHDRHPQQRQGVLLLRAGVFALASAPWRSAALAVRPHLLAIRENERRARFLGIPVERHIWLSWVISCFFVSVAGALYALLNNFADPRALRYTSRAISSSWR